MNKFILLLIPTLLLIACESMEEREIDDEENELYKRQIEYREEIMLEEEEALLDEADEQDRAREDSIRSDK
ncbi:MAG: hypothetical protein WC748_02615 [Legionellales bacterium]|jgi:hypothetical protein